jgi:UDP-N-acetylglucosamine/UDP-N-acetylgalactosamine diphosphorylase
VSDREALDAALSKRGLEAVWEAAQAVGGGASRRLAADLAQIDWSVYDRQRALLDADSTVDLDGIAAPELLPSSRSAAPGHDQARTAGWDALQAGEVALVTVAGGQASRLGFNGPKGAFPIGPVTGASLFQGFAGQIARLRERAGARVPWIVQTGPGNHAETVAYFERRNYFGLRGDLHFVCQGTLPALARDGQLLLSAPDTLFRNPDGHGGIWQALGRDGLLTRLQEAGTQTFFYFQVDNPLVPMADPVFLGYHLLANAGMSAKVISKTNPAEKVGLVVARKGRHECLEYSDLDAAMQDERAEDGSLQWRAGNIAMHAFSADFAAQMAGTALPLHAARKRVLALNKGLLPVTRVGVKFETFVFDALPLAEHSVIQLADRDEEFSPVKNRFGVDSIATARHDLAARNLRWMERAGLPAPTPGAAVEIAPGICLDPGDLSDRRTDLELLGGRLLRPRS